MCYLELSVCFTGDRETETIFSGFTKNYIFSRNGKCILFTKYRKKNIILYFLCYFELSICFTRDRETETIFSGFTKKFNFVCKYRNVFTYLLQNVLWYRYSNRFMFCDLKNVDRNNGIQRVTTLTFEDALNFELEKVKAIVKINVRKLQTVPFFISFVPKEVWCKSVRFRVFSNIYNIKKNCYSDFVPVNCSMK